MNRDNVSHPQHYTGQGAFECIEIMQLLFSPQEMNAFCLCNAFKYVWRAEYKNNKEEDLKKAEWYVKKSSEVESDPFFKDASVREKHASIRNKLRVKIQDMRKVLTK